MLSIIVAIAMRIVNQNSTPATLCRQGRDVPALRSGPAGRSR